MDDSMAYIDDEPLIVVMSTNGRGVTTNCDVGSVDEVNELVGDSANVGRCMGGADEKGICKGGLFTDVYKYNVQGSVLGFEEGLEGCRGGGTAGHWWNFLFDWVRG